MKYLALIRCIALLHQYQRPVKTITHDGQSLAYVEVTLDDIAAANRLAHHVLGRCLDEMPPQTRRLLELIERLVVQRCAAAKLERSDVLFRARQVREFTGWGSSQLHVHLQRLVELEYLLAHRADHGQGFVYELVYDGAGKDGGRFLPGLLDVEKLRGRADNGGAQIGSGTLPHDYGEKRPGLATELPGPNGQHPAPVRPVSGALPGPVRGAGNGVFPSEKSSGEASATENAHLEGAPLAVAS